MARTTTGSATNAHGLVYAGANDNASGAAVVVEAARAAVTAGWRPRRTVYFVTFGGEEMGLLGSRKMVADPPFDPKRIVGDAQSRHGGAR